MNDQLSILPKSIDAPQSPTKRLGELGEQLAIRHLEARGFAPVLANFKVRIGRNRNGAAVTGEIDIVAVDDGTLCFIEVKTRSSDEFIAPEAAVDRRKQRKIIRTARAYRRIFGLRSLPYRFDVVSVVIGTGIRPKIELKKNYFGSRNWGSMSDTL